MSGVTQGCHLAYFKTKLVSFWHSGNRLGTEFAVANIYGLEKNVFVFDNKRFVLTKSVDLFSFR